MRLCAENEKMTTEFTSLENKVKELNFAYQNSKLEFVNAMGNAIGEISKQFCRFMFKLDATGEICLENCPTERSCDYGLIIKVKFSGNRSLRKLDHMRQSGGERCISTMLYMLALQKSCKVPFRFLDEINQGVDEQNERLLMQLINSLVQELKSDTAGGHSTCTSQYFLLSPKVLRDDSYGDYCKVGFVCKTQHI
ncbi:conserved hypothetical protein [Trichinella spiralis]|nr:conserved hypothetical protein [Trichinella spiralis]